MKLSSHEVTTNLEEEVLYVARHLWLNAHEKKSTPYSYLAYAQHLLGYNRLGADAKKRTKRTHSI
jgi:hypothetical protein